MNKSLIRNVIWPNLVLLLLINIIVDVTYWIPEYTLISAGYFAKGYYIINNV